MDIRQIRYFLEVAREGSISHAAERLYITQPSLTRRMQNLESEVGRSLFIRGGRRLRLTETGELLKKRAEQITELFDKTEAELLVPAGEPSGDVFIGGGETRAMKLLTDVAAKLHADCPGIYFHIYSGDMSDISERLDKGLADFGLFIEPADLGKYEYLTLPFSDEWGIIMPSGHPLAAKESITPEDLAGVPLMRSRHSLDRSAISEWVASIPDPKPAATYNLLYNATLMAEAGIGCVLCINGIVNLTGSETLCFRPLSPAVRSGVSVAWKKDQVFSRAASLFLKYLKASIAEK
ncbi:MAG TPA: LysR family transcriptional regulator [Candidatus Protoclostridium stercorigallinarum]|uniref:LysR family transcriptional regulator n=1 Tax=Candidatus Protoclostridium stercorigallinarum TaxID=2838741 RepID=A0A9D1PYJ9_9FIRM|nr:LysR family transcriptional regulator [Candidatus Protoclostridium stercorigallinarum]